MLLTHAGEMNILELYIKSIFFKVSLNLEIKYNTQWYHVLYKYIFKPPPPPPCVSGLCVLFYVIVTSHVYISAHMEMFM